MQREKCTLSIIILLVLNILCLPAICEVQQDFYITAKDIMNAQPIPPDVNFSNNVLREIKTMEKRHFSSVNTYDSDKYRIP